MEPTTLTAPVADGTDAALLADEHEGGETTLPGDSAAPQGVGAGAPPEPAPGSDAAASLDFGRNLSKLRDARGLTHNQLAALADIAVDSIKEYELGKYRPKQPKLWSLARVLDVMPISLGPGSTRGGEPPVPFDLQLRAKGSRALRLQRLVELLTEGSVSAFSVLTGIDVESIYTAASQEAKLSDLQLEPYLAVLPQVRRSWLLNGGTEEPLQAVQQPVAASPEAQAGTGLPAAAMASAGPVTPEANMEASSASIQGPAPLAPAVAAPPVAANPVASVQALIVPQQPGEPLYVKLGGGLVAEVEAGLVNGVGTVLGVRLLAGAGQLPGLTTADQLECLFHRLRGVLDQRAGE